MSFTTGQDDGDDDDDVTDDVTDEPHAGNSLYSP